MAITLTLVETLLLKRSAGRMEAAGMDIVTVPHNQDLLDPVLFALLCMDILPGDPLALTDADLAPIGLTNIQELLDLSELRLLENVVGNLALVDISVGPRKENLSQMVEQTEKAIARLNTKIQNVYGLGIATIEGGVMSLDFAAKGDDINVATE